MTNAWPTADGGDGAGIFVQAAQAERRARSRASGVRARGPEECPRPRWGFLRPASNRPLPSSPRHYANQRCWRLWQRTKRDREEEQREEKRREERRESKRDRELERREREREGERRAREREREGGRERSLEPRREAAAVTHTRLRALPIRKNKNKNIKDFPIISFYLHKMPTTSPTPSCSFCGNLAAANNPRAPVLPLVSHRQRLPVSGPL